MVRRFLFRLVLLIVIASMGVFVSGVQANGVGGCQPDPGAGSTDNDAVICNGDDLDGVNVGSGNDSVEIAAGTVKGSIISEGGTLNIVVLGAFDTTTTGYDAIVGTGPLDVTLNGDVRSGQDVVIITGNGTINSTGNHYSSFGSGLIILADGDNNSGHINNTGDIFVRGLNQPQLYGSYGYGLSVDQGSIVSVGNITSTRSTAIHIEDGTVNTTGDLAADHFGVVMESGEIVSVGNVTIDGTFHDGSSGFRIFADGNLTTTGNISGGYSGIHVGGHTLVKSIGNISAIVFGVVIEKDSTLISEGDITASSGSAIYFYANGDITSRGDIYGGTGYGIYVGGDANIDSVGDIYGAGKNGIYVGGDGTIKSVGNVTGGIMVMGDGTIDSVGDVNAAFSAIFLGGSGSVTSVGDLHGTENGIIIGYGSGQLVSDADAAPLSFVNSTGDVSGGGVGIYVIGNGKIVSLGNVAGGNVAILIEGNGLVNSQGDISGAGSGISILQDGQVLSIGDIFAASGYGISVGGDAEIVSVGDVHGLARGITVGGNGTIDTTGAITADYEGIYLEGDGRINMQGSVVAGATGIEGGAGAQTVIVSGSVDAPVAVRLNGGNDALYVQGDSHVSGIVTMGDGDDVVLIGDGAVIDDTVLGGEDAEVNGDALFIGDSQICSEDQQAVTDALALSTLDPNSGTVFYKGQEYTWAEFEHIASGGNVHPCVGQINDGRVNRFDLGAPNALFCTVGGGVSVWQIDLTGKGAFSFAVTAAQVTAAFEQAVSSGVNQQIAADSLGNVLYALSDGHTITFVGHDLREPGKQYMTTQERALCV
jgi:hypothetical protein